MRGRYADSNTSSEVQSGDLNSNKLCAIIRTSVDVPYGARTYAR